MYENRYLVIPYIESDNYSYINTQIIPTMDKDFYFLGEIPEQWNEAGNKQIPFFWTRESKNSYTSYGCIYDPQYPDYIRAYRNSYGLQTNAAYHTKIHPLSSRTIEYQTAGQYFYLNGDKYEFPESLPTESVPYPIYLFKLDQDDKIQYSYNTQSGIKIYRWRVTQGNTILQDLVPVYDAINNKYGMYDIITNQFFGNAAETGQLLGPAKELINGKLSCANETNNIAPYSPTGTISIDDCGRVLHFGNYKLYLTTKKQTSPSLVVQYDNNLFYGAMTTENRGHLRIEYNNKIYSVYNPNAD